jgi:hypothetical protein
LEQCTATLEQHLYARAYYIKVTGKIGLFFRRTKMIALYLALLNGFTPDIKRTHVIDETFVQHRIQYQSKGKEEDFMDNSNVGWVGRIFPVIVLISFIAVILMGLYECTANKNDETFYNHSLWEIGVEENIGLGNSYKK